LITKLTYLNVFSLKIIINVLKYETQQHGSTDMQMSPAPLSNAVHL